MNNDPKNWNAGAIGINTSVGSLSWNAVSLGSSPEMVGATSDPYKDSYGTMDVANPTKADGTADRRYKDRSFTTASPGKSRAMAKGLLALDVMNASAEMGFRIAIWSDQKKVGKHSGLMRKATEDINSALEQGMIPEEYMNTAGISALINFVFQEENLTNDENISTIGQRIIDEISKKREENR